MADEIEEGKVAAVIVKSVAGDGYGTKVAAIGVPLVRIVPPAKGALSRVTAMDYEAAGTAHSITFMTVLGDVSPGLTADVAINGAVFYIDAAVHDVAGNVPASGDWIVVKATNELCYLFHVASYASLAITITVTSGWGDANGTGVPVTFATGAKLWFFGSPTVDHPDRRHYMKASTQIKKDRILATSPKLNQPIIVHSDNATAAALDFTISYDNPKPTS